MLGGFPGIKPTEMIIIGAGTVAEYAARTAIGLGAYVKIFDDSIAMGGHIIDIHAPAGASEQRRDAGPAYQIPFRCLVPKKIDNLIVAGRTVSTTHVAHASIRVMGTCMGIGQGAGAAAALAAEGDGVARNVNTEDLRSRLKNLGAVTE